jgi:hypothetical protein
VKFPYVKIVDLGQNNEHSPDGKLYFTSHGSTRPDGPVAWMSGDEVHMARVDPSLGPLGINDGANYEFYAGEKDGVAVWSQDFDETVPYFSWWNNSGITAMTYFPRMRKLIAVTETTCLGCGVRVDFDFDTYILEADSADGTIPGASAFKLVTYQQHFGPQAYCVQIPSRFAPDGKPGYMAMAANFAEGTSHRRVDGVNRLKLSAVVHPTGGDYGINLQATQFCGPRAGVACTPARAAPHDRARARVSGMAGMSGMSEGSSDVASGTRTFPEWPLPSLDPDMSSDEEAIAPVTAAQPSPAYPLGKTAAAIWADTNIRLGSTNASILGFASFNITGPSSPFAPLAARLFTQLVGAATYATSVVLLNITALDHFVPLGPSDRSTLGVHAFADKDCTNTVLILVNTDATEKIMDGPTLQGRPLWYLHRAQWVLTMASSGGHFLLNGKPIIVGAAGVLPSMSGHSGQGFGLLVLPPHSVSYVRLGLIPNCRPCVAWEGSNSSCIP